MTDQGVAASLPARPSKTVIAWSDQHPAQTPGQPCVSLPFTAPSLIQMRARQSSRGDLEMLLGNPSGGRGLYVSSWSALRRYASPTVHDIILAEKIEQNAVHDIPLTTVSVRALAIDVAAEGHAGRKLAQAARRARCVEADREQRMKAHLVLCLARALLPNAGQVGLMDARSGGSLTRTDWLYRASYHLAPHFDDSQPWDGAELATALTELAQAATPLGRGPDDESAPVRRTRQLLAGARQLRHLRKAIDPLLAREDSATARAHHACSDAPALLAAWRADPANTRLMLQASTSILDGWDRLCLLPEGSDEQARFAQTLLDHETVSKNAGAAITDGWQAPAASLDTASLRLRELWLLDPDIDLDQVRRPI